jgi:hypothetical protein
MENRASRRRSKHFRNPTEVSMKVLLSAIALAMGAGSPILASAASDASPATIVTLPTERIGSDVPGPQSPSAAREEAAAAWAENRRACREEADRQARQECLEAAREDRDRLLEYASQSSQGR